MHRILSGGLAFCVLLGGCAVKVEKAAENRPAVEADRNQFPQAVTSVEGMEKGLFLDGRV